VPFQEEDRNMQLLVFKHNTGGQTEPPAFGGVLGGKYLHP